MNVSSGRLRWHYFGGFGMVFLVLLFAAMGVGFLIGAVFTYQHETEFGEKGVTAIGEVIDKGSRISRSSRGGSTTHYWIKYSFKDFQGMSYEGKGDIGRDDWHKMQRGSSVRIEYIKSDPADNRPALHRTGANYTTSYILFGVGGVLTALMLGFLFYNWSNSTRLVRLVRDGQIALGVVSNIEMKSTGKTTTYTMHYKFKDPAGMTQRGQYGSISSSQAAAWPAGTPIIVCHDGNDPTQHTPDLYQAWREEREQLVAMLEKQTGGTIPLDTASL